MLSILFHVRWCAPILACTAFSHRVPEERAHPLAPPGTRAMPDRRRDDAVHVRRRGHPAAEDQGRPPQARQFAELIQRGAARVIPKRSEESSQNVGTRPKKRRASATRGAALPAHSLTLGALIGRQRVYTHLPRRALGGIPGQPPLRNFMSNM